MKSAAKKNKGAPPLSEHARILIIKTQAIGDLLMATPAIRDLRNTYPLAHLALLVGSWSAPAIRKNPLLDEIIEFDDRTLLDRRWFKILALLLRLRRKRFDCAIIFHPSPFLHLLALLAGIPVRYGLTRGSASRFLTQGIVEDLGEEVYYPVNFQRVVALTGAKTGNAEIEIHTSIEDENEARKILEEAGIHVDAGFLLVAPGGGRNSKEDIEARRWPKESFAVLLKELRRDRPHLQIVVCGSMGDREETDFLSSQISGAANLTGKTSITQLFCLTRLANAVVCNDSSTMHIGIASHIPVVTPFGPTAMMQRVPDWNQTYCVQSKIACSPCYVGGRFPGCSIGFQCMKEMGWEQIKAPLDLALGSLGKA